jgi:hypothetical protein
MPYSRAKEKRLAKLKRWPDIRYGPSGQIKLFYSPEEVPFGWTSDKPSTHMSQVDELLDHDELIAKLTEMGVEINHTWGHAHMKRIIDGDVSPTG